MTGTFVDSSVVIDAMAGDANWSHWARERIGEATEAGPLWINGIVYAEAGHRFEEMAQLDLAISLLGLQILDIPKPVFFVSARAFREYRQRGGDRTSILPDFIIGAHASLLNVPLLTRDPKRFRQAFPDLEIIAP